MVRCPFHWQISHGVEFLCECNAILSLVLPILMVMIMIMMKTQNIAFCQASQCMIWSAILSLVLLFLFFVSYRSPSLVIRIKLFHLTIKMMNKRFQWQRTQCDDDDYEGDDKVIFHLLLFLVLLTASIPHHLKPCWWWYVWWCWWRCIVININDDVGMMMVITSALALALSGDEM